MSDLSSLTGGGPHAAGYVAPAPAPAAQPAPPPAAPPAAGSEIAAPSPAASGRSAQAAAVKTEHADVTAGSFNPSVTIDPDTHILVMTIRAPDGDVLRQMPNQHELAAYKANATEHKKGA